MPFGIEGMTTEKESAPRPGGQWLDWLSAHMWWTALLVGSALCVVALALS